MSLSYADFLARKGRRVGDAGTAAGALHPALFPFQRDIVAWALRRGRAAVFADCGLGKSLMQLAWADAQPARTIILAPLAVARQTEREAERFGIAATYDRTGKSDARIVLANYEMLSRFDPREFGAVVLDESSILKGYDRSTRIALTEAFAETSQRLCCTATPSPNDWMELGTHAEFLGHARREEMLAEFFVHDGGDTSKWRLKGHAESAFWDWVAEWAALVRSPSDLGYPDEGFKLPALDVGREVVDAAQSSSVLFPTLVSEGLRERLAARRDSVEARVERAAAIANADAEQWIVWCALNTEADKATAAIRGAVNVEGADSLDAKEGKIGAFLSGAARVLVTKPSICGMGLNLQQCRSAIFLGLSDSWEAYYQAVRRIWRFGQKRPVRIVEVIGEGEVTVAENVRRKALGAETMGEQLAPRTRRNVQAEAAATAGAPKLVSRGDARGATWRLRLGDAVELIRDVPDRSIGYSVFSPPFASLYTYTDQAADMGNCRTAAEFHEHFGFLVGELLRVTQPGRLLSFHCMNLPTSKVRDGVIGLTDFRGDLIRMFRQAGWIFHSEAVIWKDPVTAMQRTKALGLLHKQVCKDSAMSRQGIPDYLVTMRAPGENLDPIAGDLIAKHDRSGLDGAGIARQLGAASGKSLSIGLWQLYASPVWMDINPSDTLQIQSARAERDEKHICPLQLEVVERAMVLWSRPGDTVLSPFAGIGSEGFVACRMGRRFLGFELKESYAKQAALNLAEAERLAAQRGLFGTDAEAAVDA